MANSSYVVKRVEFFGRTVKICMQNKNGPCPLLAIANVLSLRNELKLPAGIREITQADLITAIVDLLLERSQHYESSTAHAADYQQHISDIFPVLQKLTTGIDVNVKFHNIYAFEPTPEVAVFDLLGIPLVHGWLVNPADKQTTAVFGNRSYNELMEVLLAGLDDAEVEALSQGPLRNLSITHSSFSAAHSQQQQQQAAENAVAQQDAQQRGSSSGSMTSSMQQQDVPQQSTACDTLPRLPSIATSSTTATGAAAVNEDGVLIGHIVEEIMQHVCGDHVPSKIELGDSPTHSTSLTRKLAYEGAGPSRLGSSNNGTTATAEAAAAAVAPSEQQQQPSEPQQHQDKAHADAHVVREFMEAHCSQLTPYGLGSLGDSLKEHQLAVFFRNNHFNTLFKYEGRVYLLVTDQGYEAEPDIVWETLDSVNGDTTFCTGGFSSFVPHRDATAGLTYSQVASGEGAVRAAGQTPAADTDLDAAIAASLAAETSDGYVDLGRSSQHGGVNSQSQHGAPQGTVHSEGHNEDADFALALQLQLQEEESARLAAERQQQQQPQQQHAGRGQQLLSPRQQQQVQQQQQSDSIADNLRQMGRRIATGVERTAASLSQQAAQLAAPEYAGQGQHGQQQRRRQGAVAAGGHGGLGRRRSQQEEKCSIM